MWLILVYFIDIYKKEKNVFLCYWHSKWATCSKINQKHWFRNLLQQTKRKPRCFSMKDSNVTNKTHKDVVTLTSFISASCFNTTTFLFFSFFVLGVIKAKPQSDLLFLHWKCELPDLCDTAADAFHRQGFEGRRSLYNRYWLIPISGLRSLTFMFNWRKNRDGRGSFN